MQHIKETQQDRATAFLLDARFHQSQFITRKEALKICRRLKALHTKHTTTPANSITAAKIEKAILLNGGTGFWSYLNRKLV